MRALTTVCLLLLATSASAEFPDHEKTQARTYHEAVSALEDALSDLAWALPAQDGTQRAYSVQALKRMQTAHAAWNRGLARLLGVNTEQELYGPTSASQALDAQPRAQWIASAEQFLDDGLAELRQITNVPARTVGLVNGAIAIAERFDRALLYDNPRPRDYPRIIGPHGSWKPATERLAIGQRALTASLTHAFNLYANAPNTLPDRAVIRVAALSRLLRATMVNWTMIPVTPAECGMNRFHLVSASLARLTSQSAIPNNYTPGAAYEYSYGLYEFAPLRDMTRIIAWSVYASLVQSWMTAWQATSDATWQALAFPDPATLAQIRQQGFPNSDPFGPPLCSGG